MRKKNILYNMLNTRHTTVVSWRKRQYMTKKVQHILVFGSRRQVGLNVEKHNNCYIIIIVIIIIRILGIRYQNLQKTQEQKQLKM